MKIEVENIKNEEYSNDDLFTQIFLIIQNDDFFKNYSEKFDNLDNNIKEIDEQIKKKDEMMERSKEIEDKMNYKIQEYDQDIDYLRDYIFERLGG